jgi:tetratricopeptide (TPR) repeat protein
MNSQNNQTIFDLVTEYEALSARGEVAFLDEKDFLRVISYYEEEDQIGRALEVVEHAMGHHGFSVDFFIKKAQLLMDGDRLEEALEVLEDATLFSPNDLTIRLLQAEAMAYLGLYAEALAALETAKTSVRKGNDLSDILTVEAVVYECQEQYERMFFTLEAAVLEDPRNEEALDRLWFCVELTKNYEASITLHNAVLNRDPYASVAWYNLGHAHAYMGNYEEAIEAYEYAFITNEKFEEAYRHFAELCLEMRQYHKALNGYQEMIEHFDPDSELYFNVGQCYQHLGQFNLARKNFKRALSMDPLNDEVFFHIGECYAAEGKWKSAVRPYRKAVQIEDSREEYFSALARVYCELGEPAKAEPFFQKATELAPDQSEYWLQYASFLLDNDQGDRALMILEDAAEEAPETEMLYGRVACLLTMGRRKEAHYWLGEALHEDFEGHRLLFELMPGLEYEADIITFIDRFR